MKISVITVCKNVENTIEKTIESILNQTYKNFEIIVIDGVSTDKTLNILAKYGNCINLTSEPDSGIYNAMNKGIAKATGDILFFLNADDYLYSDDIFLLVVEKFKKDPLLMFLWGDINLASKEGSILKEISYKSIKTKMDIAANNICHQAIFYKKELFDKYGTYNESYKILADWDVNIRFLVEEKVKCLHIDKFITVFQTGGLSTNGNNDIKKLHKIEQVSIKKRYFPVLSKFLGLDKCFCNFSGSIYKPLKNFFVEKFFNKLNFAD